MCRTIILPFILYEWETWSVTLRKVHRLKVFKNRVLRKMFGLKEDDVTGEWRWLHSEEFYGLFSSPNVIWVIKSRRMRWMGHVAHMGTMRNAYRVLVGKPEGKRPLGMCRHRREDNIKIGLQEVGWETWTGFIWLRLGRGDRLLWMRWWTFRFHKMWGISCLAEDLLVCQVLCCMELVISQHLFQDNMVD